MGDGLYDLTSPTEASAVTTVCEAVDLSEARLTVHYLLHTVPLSDRYCGGTCVALSCSDHAANKNQCFSDGARCSLALRLSREQKRWLIRRTDLR
jgi:hypothetical protein